MISSLEETISLLKKWMNEGCLLHFVADAPLVADRVSTSTSLSGFITDVTSDSFDFRIGHKD